MLPSPTSDREPLAYAPRREVKPGWWLLPLAVLAWTATLLFGGTLAALMWSYCAAAKPLPGTLVTPLLGLVTLVLVPIATLLTRAALESRED